MRPTLLHPFAKPEGRPACIAHRGAQAHAPENTLHAFRVAHDLGADMWEIDIRLSADGVPVVSHDDSIAKVHGPELRISQEMAARLKAAAPDLPLFSEVVALARDLGQGLYVELKSPGAGQAALALVGDFTALSFGSFLMEEVRALIERDCPFPVAILVPLGADPMALARDTGADLVHLCWERASETPQDLVTPDLLAALETADLGLVRWHEERPAVLAALETLPALGICTDQPELMRGFRGEASGIEVVCHRGMNHIAPENTRAAAALCYDFGCDWLELDVRESADGELVVLHDPTLDRTSTGTGPVTEQPLAALRELDFGSWASPFYAGERIQTLREAIALCQSRGRRMYIEIKQCDIEKLWALVCEMGFETQCFFWSGNMQAMLDLRSHAPEARFKSNIIHHGGSYAVMMAQLAPAICEIQLGDWDREAPRCRRDGVIPMLQYFGKDPRIFDRIAHIRPEMINLDRADLLLAALRKAAG